MLKFLGVAVFLFNFCLIIPVTAQGPFITIGLSKSSTWYNCAGSPTANYINYTVVKTLDGAPTSLNIPGKFAFLPFPPKDYPFEGFNSIVAAESEIYKYLNGREYEYNNSLSCFDSPVGNDKTCRRASSISPAKNICLAVTNVNDKSIKVQLYLTFSKMATGGTNSTVSTTNTTNTTTTVSNNTHSSGNTTQATDGNSSSISNTSSTSSANSAAGTEKVNSSATIRLSLSKFLSQVFFTIALSWVYFVLKTL
ncbi:hypothetical protein G9A89_003499 [Geosiphon pyriformis]|nr:hypothetical protein G9A89_003499 [Geosiphon pyriformis]